MTTHTAAAAEPRPESAYEIANDVSARAGDLRRLAEVTYQEVTELKAPAGTAQMEHLSRASALCRVLEDYARQLEVRSEYLISQIDRVTA